MTWTYRFLGFSLLTSALLTGCPGGGNPGVVRQSGGAGFEDSLVQLAEFECQCIGELEGPEGEALCQEEVDEFLGLDSIGACIDDVLADHPGAAEPMRCLVGAQYDYLECVTAQGCPGTFSCADGSTIVEDWVCDGEADCAGGEDEAADCPGPHVCLDGETIPSGWVCDGWDDCGDGTDEPADCDVGCEIGLGTSYETCPALPETFELQVDEECFDAREAEPGQCIGEGCPGEPEPACPDGACSVDEPGGELVAGSSSGRPRPHLAIQAARHLVLRR